MRWATVAALLVAGGVHRADASAHQHWILKNGLLKYKANPAYCASVREGKISDGYDIILWHCAKQAPNNEFVWEVDGDYIRLAADKRYCMSVREGNDGDGSHIILWKCEETKAFQWIVEGERVKFKAHPKYWLAIREDKAYDGANLILWSGWTNADRWRVEGSMIKSDSEPDKCVGVMDAKAGKGSHAVLWGCDGHAGRLGKADLDGSAFAFEMTGPTAGDLIKHKASGKCLSVRANDIRDGAGVILWTCQSTAEFGWLVSGQYIRLKSSPDYCLTVREGRSAGDGTDLTLWTCEAPEEIGVEVETKEKYQKPVDNEFHWVMVGNQLKSKVDQRKCASVQEGIITDGSHIIMWHCSDAPEFQWKLDGALLKVASNPKYCLSVKEGKGGDGSNVILWTCEDSTAFRWSYDEASGHISWKADARYLLSVRAGKVYDGADVILWSGYANPFLFFFDDNLLKLKVDPTLCVSLCDGCKAGDGSGIVLWKCDRNEANLWQMEDTKIRLDSKPNMCMSAREGKHQDGTDIVLWTCDAGSSGGFDWVLVNGRLRYKKNEHYCLSAGAGHVGDGSPVVLWSCDELLSDPADEL